VTTEKEMHEGTLQGDGMHCESGNCWCWKDRYQVVTRENLEDLIGAVNAFIHQKGWKPAGGVSLISMSFDDDGRPRDMLWAQAMVRHV
jgi:hypothetical protein